MKANNDATYGDSYCFTALERNTKLILTWHLGRRTARDTEAFTEKLKEVTSGNSQITTDGFRPYRDAVSYSLGTRVDFAQLIKVYASSQEETRYSSAEVVSTEVCQLSETPTRKSFALRMSRGRTSRYGCRFAASRA